MVIPDIIDGYRRVDYGDGLRSEHIGLVRFFFNALTILVLSRETICRRNLFKVMHESSFNIRTPRDFLHEMVIPQHKDFVANNSSSRHALLTIILVYHMYEWVHGKKFSTEHFNSTYENRGEMAEMFELAGKISNGTKHFRRKVKTQVQHGFSSAFSDAFARPLNVEFNGKKQSVDSFLRKMVEFWKHQEQVGVF